MPTLGLENRQANEALDEDRKANKRVFRNEQKQVAVSKRTELPPTMIERRTVYELDIGIGEINSILSQRIQAIQAPLQAQIPNIDPNAPPPPPVAPGPINVDLTPIIPIWNKLISIIDVYAKGVGNNATSADFQFISQKLKGIEANLQLVLMLIDNFGGQAPAGVIGNVSGLRQAREIATQIQNGIAYTKITDVGPVAQNQPQLQQQIANAQNQLQFNQLQQMAQQQQQGIPAQPQPQPPQPLPAQAIQARQLQGFKRQITDDIIQGIANPADRPTQRQLGPLIMIAVNAMAQTGPNFQVPFLDAQGQLDLQNFAQLYPYNTQQTREFARFMNSIINYTQLYINAFNLAFGVPQVQAGPPIAPPPYQTNPPGVQVNPVYTMIFYAILNYEAQTNQSLVNPQDLPALDQMIRQEVWFPQLLAVSRNDPQAVLDNIRMVIDDIRGQRNAYAQQFGVNPQALIGQGMGSGFFDDLRGFTNDVGKAVGAEPFTWNPLTNIYRSIKHSLPVQLGKLAFDVAGKIQGGRNDRANSGSLFLSNRGDADRHNRYAGSGGAHPLSRLVGGADDEEPIDLGEEPVGDDPIDIGADYPNIGIDPYLFAFPDGRPNTNFENMWRTAGRFAGWADANVRNVAQFTQWLTINAVGYARAVLTNPRVIALAKEAGRSTKDFILENPATALLYVLPGPLQHKAVATAIVGYLGRNWWRDNVGRGGVMPLHTRTEPALHGGVNGKRGPQSYRIAYEGPIEPFDVFTGMNANLTASDMTAGLAKYMATQVPDAGLSNPYYRTPSHDQNVFTIGSGGSMEERLRGIFDSKGQISNIPLECRKIMERPITMEYDPQPDGTQNRMASQNKRLYEQCLARSKIETPPQNVGLPNFLRVASNNTDDSMYLDDPQFAKFRRQRPQGASQPLFGRTLNVNSDRVMEQNEGKHFRSLPVREGKYIHRNKPYINAELFNDDDNEMYRGMEMERPNYGTNVLEEAPKHKAMVEEMRAEDGFFAKKHAKKLGLKKDVNYFK